MATLSVSSGDYFRPYRRVRVRGYKEGASQTFIVGDLVILSAVAGDENLVTISGVDPPLVAGVALEAAHGVKNDATPTMIALADQEGEFLARVVDGQTASASLVGKSLGVTKDATNKIWRVDTTKTAAGLVVVVVEVLDVGDINGRVVCKFIGTVAKPYSF